MKTYDKTMEELWAAYPIDVEMSFTEWVRRRMEKAHDDVAQRDGGVESKAL
jgi:hypothetical protein